MIFSRDYFEEYFEEYSLLPIILCDQIFIQRRAFFESSKRSFLSLNVKDFLWKSKEKIAEEYGRTAQ